ncbi:MAG: hypothetical protein M1839_007271 [Geoglossum umbratile]|nr:MAG: hypothetical protein M1839_007271 [Geoglossum umbratile]
MSAAVAADSLSSLTTLSSDPPKYPRNPALESRNPLVLYIARVPGSKDVFLTTIKPRQKTVTAEDVTCSLYYMHVDQLENDVLLYDATGGTREQFQDGRGRSSTELNRVERKPLPPNPQLLQPPVRPESSTKDRPDYRHPTPDSNRHAQLSRKPVSSSGGNISQSETGPQRRPLGPRPIGSEHQPVNQPPGLENVPPNRQTERRPALPPRSGLSAPPGDISLSRGRSESPTKRSGISVSGNDGSKTSSMSNLPPPGPRHSLDVPAYPRRPSSDIVSPEDISITIIRRDPASSNQWNVGKITVTSAPDGHLTPRQQSRSSSHAKAGGVQRRILIEITNPGYTKFLPPKRPPFYPPPDSEGRIPFSEDQESIRWKDFAYQNGMSSQPPDERDTDIDDEVFRREVWAEGVGFWDRNLRRMSGNGTANFPANNTTLSTSRASPNFGGTASTGLRGNETGESFTKPMARGDVFISPWDGRCEFSTGAGGRSLKCKHTLPVGDTSARQVSELRFNLPTSSTFSSGSSSEMKKSLIFAKNIRKHFHSSHRHYDSESVSAASPAPSDDNGGDKRPGLDRRLSIALGQEKAGGGSGGKRSKLGKLIVESEGQMMLDLIVAANMGIWWRAWERIDGNALAGELD